MVAKAISTSMRFGEIILNQDGFLPTHIPLASGATLLTSLDYQTAEEVVFRSSHTGKARLQQNADGRIEIVDSLWMAYGDTHTDLHDINDLIRIKDRLLSLCHKGDDECESVVIIDWGCGAGHTLAQLDRWLREMKITWVSLFGYANEFHVDWLEAPDSLTFILDVADNLPRYFAARSVDFIYSIAGLYYLFIPQTEGSDDDMLEFFRKRGFDGRLFKNYAHTERHLEALSGMMKCNGELLIDLPVHVIDIDYSLLKSGNRHYRTLRNPDKYGEHAYVLVPNEAATLADPYAAVA